MLTPSPHNVTYYLNGPLFIHSSLTAVNQAAMNFHPWGDHNVWETKYIFCSTECPLTRLHLRRTCHPCHRHRCRKMDPLRQNVIKISGKKRKFQRCISCLDKEWIHILLQLYCPKKFKKSLSFIFQKILNLHPNWTPHMSPTFVSVRRMCQFKKSC